MPRISKKRKRELLGGLTSREKKALMKARTKAKKFLKRTDLSTIKKKRRRQIAKISIPKFS